VKTTIDIPEALYRRAKIRAAQTGTSMRELVLHALQRALDPAQAAPSTPALAKSAGKLYTLNEHGFAVLKRPLRDRTVITDEWISKMREEAGI